MIARERCVALIAAGGASSRMGRPKALLPWGDGPLIQRQWEALKGFGQVTIVLGHDAEAIGSRLEVPAWVRIVQNPHPEAGRASSLRCGFESLPEHAAAVLVVAVDQPLLAPGVRGHSPLVVPLLQAFEPDHHAYAAPSYQGRSGHPILFCGSLLPELRAIEERSLGLRAVTRDHVQARLIIPVDSALVLCDLNTPSDYEAALGGWNPSGSRSG